MPATTELTASRWLGLGAMDISTRLCSFKTGVFEPSSSNPALPALPPAYDESVPSSTSTSVTVRVPKW